MKLNTRSGLFLCLCFTMVSCVSKKQFTGLQNELLILNEDMGRCGQELNKQMAAVTSCRTENERLKGELRSAENNLGFRQEQINDLKDQMADIRKQRDRQVEQVGDLTVLSQSASDNIKETLSQLEGKDKYISILQAAKTKTDSINLALAVNLKGVLQNGIEDKDIEVRIDKTVVMINLSDKMLYQSGSSKLTSQAYDVLRKIAQIVASRPDLEVMVEGYTDNVPISKPGIEDNWDLSVKRATSVVRVLQKNFDVDPNRMIAAGRGEYNTLASNDTREGRSVNRRTRIIIMPKIDQFYDLLNPNMVPD